MFSAKNESVPEEPASCNGWRPESRIGNEIPAKPTASVRIASRCVLYDGPRILERLLVIILRRRPLFQECFVSWKFEQTALGALTIVVIGLTPVPLLHEAVAGGRAGAASLRARRAR
jgi:hypothetical protein